MKNFKLGSLILVLGLSSMTNAFADTLENRVTVLEAQVAALQRGGADQFKVYCACDCYDNINCSLRLHSLNVSTGADKIVNNSLQYYGGTGAPAACNAGLNQLPLCR